MHAYFDGLILRLLKSTCFHVIKRSNASYQLVVSALGEQDQYLLFDYLPTFKLSEEVCKEFTTILLGTSS